MTNNTTISKAAIMISFLSLALHLNAQQKYKEIYPLKKPVKTIIAGALPEGNCMEKMGIACFDYSSYHDWKLPEYLKKEVNVINNIYHIDIYIDRPTYCLVSYFGEILLEPGDSIYIEEKGRKGPKVGNVFFSGKGSEKMKCIQTIYQKEDLSDNPEFSKRINHSDSLEGIIVKIIDSYKRKLTHTAFTILKADYVPKLSKGIGTLPVEPDLNMQNPISRKLIKQKLAESSKIMEKRDPALTYCKIFPTVLKNRILMWYSLEKGLDWKDVYYSFKKEYYIALSRYLPKGLLRERIIANYLADAFNRYGFNPDLEICSKQFLAQTSPTSSYYKGIGAWLQSSQERLSKGAPAYPFVLEDTVGNKIKMEDFREQVVLMDFMFTGCGGCMQMVPSLKKVEQAFRQCKDVVFISVSTDVESRKNEWKIAAAKGIYSVPGSIQLYTNGKGYDCPITRHYDINIYPTLVLIGKHGKLVSARAPNPRIDNGDALMKLIQQEVDSN